MKKAYLFAATSILCWSTFAASAKLLLNDLNNIQLLWANSFFAMIFLLLVILFTGKIKLLKSYKLRDYINMILIGFPGTFLYYMFYYAGADRLPASQALIINYMWPVMSVVFACIILKEKMTLKKGIAIGVSFLGVCIVTGEDLLQLNQNMAIGALLCILGAMSYGIFTALNNKYHYDKTTSMMLSYFATFLLTGVINLVNDDMFLPSFGQVLGFAWSGVFTMAIANTVWILALEAGNTAIISNLAYITPFLSLVWTSLLLKEEITVSSIAGLIVIVLGIFIQLIRKPRKLFLLNR